MWDREGNGEGLPRGRGDRGESNVNDARLEGKSGRPLHNQQQRQLRPAKAGRYKVNGWL
jgi:hypothetical protein